MARKTTKKSCPPGYRILPVHTGEGLLYEVVVSTQHRTRAEAIAAAWAHHDSIKE